MIARFGYILSLIAGIIILLSGILIIAFPITPEQSLALKVYTGQNVPATSDSVPIGAFFSGIVIIYGAFQIRKDGFESRNGKLVILFSFLNLFVSGVGSLMGILGSILGFIGGILAILKK